MTEYTLVGVDGNAFAIMGYVQNAMRRTGCTKEQINEYLADAKSSDYNHLLVVSQKMVDQCNGYIRDLD